jgi:hypothetical protein
MSPDLGFPDLTRDDVFRLETANLWLRWPRQSDKAGLIRAAMQVMPDAVATGPHPLLTFMPPATHGEAEALVLAARQANAAGEALVLVITRKGRDGEALGLIGLTQAGNRLRVSLWLATAGGDRRELAGESLVAMVEAASRLRGADALELDAGSTAMLDTETRDRLGFRPLADGTFCLMRDSRCEGAWAVAPSRPACRDRRASVSMPLHGHVGPEPTASRWSGEPLRS